MPSTIQDVTCDPAGASWSQHFGARDARTVGNAVAPRQSDMELPHVWKRILQIIRRSESIDASRADGEMGQASGRCASRLD
jgi:hypothetical protein